MAFERPCSLTDYTDDVSSAVRHAGEKANRKVGLKIKHVFVIVQVLVTEKRKYRWSICVGPAATIPQRATDHVLVQGYNLVVASQPL